MEYGAYFYPITTRCPDRRNRADLMGYSPVDESLLTQNATPLFRGHMQPNTYTIDGLNGTTWDDGDLSAMHTQIELAQEYGLSYFVMDTYIGRKEGKPVQEMIEPLNHLVKLNQPNFGFACMAVMGSPRVVLPVPNVPDFEEVGRYYDRTKESVRYLIDTLATLYWNNPNYLQIDQRPYLPIFTSDMSPGHDGLDLPSMIEEMKEYSLKTYNVVPWVAGVVRKVKGAEALLQAGADGLTGYAFLPQFGRDSNPIQSYRQRIKDINKEWAEIQYLCNRFGVSFIPPAVVGWDASPRGMNNSNLSDVTGVYPYTPILTSATPELFGKHLREVANYIKEQAPPAQHRATICAWNEVTEGAALLPKIIDGKVNPQYLEEVKKLTMSES
ncbi:glycoside hydrolase family 99-like domain-containing protein [Candidatus Dojkabacteria bacterium]|uniref:Glycoside hydrolase family 99-like domain-containing protein n=1 Tax=Candidatus Dojkabacteria bacterium TaxID=2099670 RepID=A0A955I8U0_9BACT|nr:glycoside hydrolase family 99-like domain-containing protein [Candidatus Dojkabacteria bacterium]